MLKELLRKSSWPGCSVGCVFFWNPESWLENSGLGAGESAVARVGGLETAVCLMGRPCLSPSLTPERHWLGIVLRPLRPGQREGCCRTHPSCGFLEGPISLEPTA